MPADGLSLRDGDLADSRSPSKSLQLLTLRKHHAPAQSFPLITPFLVVFTITVSFRTSQAVVPPSMGQATPVTNAASSEHSHRTSAATSSGSPGRLTLCSEYINDFISGSPFQAAMPAQFSASEKCETAANVVGSRLLTRMFFWD